MADRSAREAEGLQPAKSTPDAVSWAAGRLLHVCVLVLFVRAVALALSSAGRRRALTQVGPGTYNPAPPRPAAASAAPFGATRCARVVSVFVFVGRPAHPRVASQAPRPERRQGRRRGAAWCARSLFFRFIFAAPAPGAGARGHAQPCLMSACCVRAQAPARTARTRAAGVRARRSRPVAPGSRHARAFVRRGAGQVRMSPASRSPPPARAFRRRVMVSCPPFAAAAFAAAAAGRRVIPPPPLCSCDALPAALRGVRPGARGVRAARAASPIRAADPRRAHAARSYAPTVATLRTAPAAAFGPPRHDAPAGGGARAKCSPRPSGRRSRACNVCVWLVVQSKFSSRNRCRRFPVCAPPARG